MLPSLSAQQGYDLSQANVLNTITQGDAVDPSQQSGPVVGPAYEQWRRRKLGSPTMQGSMGGSAPHSPIGQHVQFAKQQASMGGNPYVTQGTGSFEQPSTPAHADKPAAATSGWDKFMPQQQAANGSSSFGGGLTNIAQATPQTKAQVRAMAGHWQQTQPQTGMQFSGDEQALLQAVQAAGGTPMEGLRMILEQRNKAAEDSKRSERDQPLSDVDVAEGVKPGGKRFTSDTEYADAQRAEQEKQGGGEYSKTESELKELNGQERQTTAVKQRIADLTQQADRQASMRDYGYAPNADTSDNSMLGGGYQQNTAIMNALPKGDGDLIKEDEARAFMTAAGGDPVVARQLAAQHGHQY